MKIINFLPAIVLFVVHTAMYYAQVSEFDGKTYNGAVISSWQDCGKSCHQTALVHFYDCDCQMTVPVSSSFYHTKREQYSETLEGVYPLGIMCAGLVPEMSFKLSFLYIMFMELVFFAFLLYLYIGIQCQKEDFDTEKSTNKHY